MVKIRLRRMGAKNKPSYRVVVADSHSPRDGRLIATIGHYNPLTNPETVVIDKDKASEWLKKGAQPTDTVRRLLGKTGVIELKPVVWPEKKRVEATEAKAEAQPEAKAATETKAT